MTLEDFWQLRAACRGMDPKIWHDHAWDQHKGQLGGFGAARKICLSCPVRLDCREYAVTLNVVPKGVFAGLDPTQLNRLRKERRGSKPA